ncbi:hypothetical protein PG997_001856 [Apiospora hydei]|uniref:Rhodopsin domain-containing protein n=1 Tax=Apiospora hydei TaxID=1337664 RepID=A0ABR1X7R0_9PEZI
MAPHPQYHELDARAGLQEGSRQASVFGVGISFIIVIAMLISVRMYVRMFMIKAVGVDDIFMLVGTPEFKLTLSVRPNSPKLTIPPPRTVADIPPTDMVPMLQSIYSTRLLYCVAMFFVKQSLLVFYLRLDHRRVMRWTVYGLMFVVAALNIASGVVLAISCFPPALFWDIEGVVDGECMAPGAQQAFYDANGYLNIITDIAIYVAPMPMLWNIQIPMRQKVALLGVFSLGFFSVADSPRATAGCVRFGYVRKLSNETDMYFLLADSLNWCELEIYVAIFCGSAPALKVLLKSWWPRLFGSSLHHTPDYQQQNGGGGGRSSKYAHMGGSGSRPYTGPKTYLSHSSGGGSGKRQGSTDSVEPPMPSSNDSKEAIIIQGNRIVRKTEFRMEVED